MLEELQRLLKQKKSNSHLAQILGCTIEQVKEGKKKLKGEVGLSIEGDTYKHNIEKGTIELSAYYDHPPTPEEVIKDHKIDTTKFKLSAYYSKAKSKGWYVTALFKNITPEEEKLDKFTEFLIDYKTTHRPIYTSQELKKFSTLLINKQDIHFNKYSVEGDNDIHDRFEAYERSVSETVATALFPGHYLQKIVYVIGSDCFNSEWTGSTVKGTPQNNILPYHVTFQLICDHETKIINNLLLFAEEVEVIYLGGNHDRHVSWHMASWLKAYYGNQKNLNIDISMEYTKFRSIYDSAVCLNHGDAQKQERLAANFPILYKKGFAEANFWYCITGDRHVESTKQVGAIKCYQIPLQSKAVSDWDSQQGYTTSPAEMLSFVFREGKGIHQIIREPIKY